MHIEEKYLTFTEAYPFQLPVIEEEPHVPSKGWAEMIYKVYEVDPLICSRYGGQMRVIAFIEDHEVIDRTIDKLKLKFRAERPTPTYAQAHLMMVA